MLQGRACALTTATAKVSKGLRVKHKTVCGHRHREWTHVAIEDLSSIPVDLLSLKPRIHHQLKQAIAGPNAQPYAPHTRYDEEPTQYAPRERNAPARARTDPCRRLAHRQIS